MVDLLKVHLMVDLMLDFDGRLSLLFESNWKH